MERLAWAVRRWVRLFVGTVILFPGVLWADYVVTRGLNTFGQCNAPEGDDFVLVAAGAAHSLALKTDGSLVMWGYGADQVPAGRDFVHISACGQYSVAVRADGSLACWSCFKSDRCFVPPGTGYKAVACGPSHAVALRSDGSVVRWYYKGGFDFDDLPEDTDFIAVAAERLRSLALRADGSVVIWGYADRLVERPENVTLTAISAGSTRWTGLTSDGAIRTFTYEKSSRNGRAPIQGGYVPYSNGFISIACCESYNLALKSNGSVAAWTSGASGKLDGSIYTAIATGKHHDVLLAKQAQPYLGRALPLSSRQRPASLSTPRDVGVVTTEETPVRIVLSWDGQPSREVIYQAAYGPSHGELTVRDGSAEMVYVPTKDFCGVDEFPYLVVAGSDRSTTATVQILVADQPDPPVAKDIRVVTYTDRPVEIDPTAADVDADILTYRLVDLPDHGKLELIDSLESIYLYTPAAGFEGQDRFTFIANDGMLNSEAASVEIMVAAKPDFPPPVFNTSVSACLNVDSPRDLVIDSNEMVYILCMVAGKNAVVVCDEKLEKGRTIITGAVSACGLAVSKQHIYVTDTASDRVLRYRHNGELDVSFGTNGVVGHSGTGEGEFDRPWGIVVDDENTAYIADHGNGRIQVLDSNGVFKRTLRQHVDMREPSGKPPEKITAPVSGYDLPRAAENESRVISCMRQVLADDRKPLNGPTGLALIADFRSQLLVMDTNNGRVKHMASFSGYLYESIGWTGSGPGQFKSALDVCYDPRTNRLVVADTGNNRVLVYALSHTGEFFATETELLHEISDLNLSAPMAVAIKSGRVAKSYGSIGKEGEDVVIYIADTGNNRVLRTKAHMGLPARDE